MHINIELIEKLYRKYKGDLIAVKELQKGTIDKINKLGAVSIIDDYGQRLNMDENNAQLCDIEAEITYLLIREFKPETIVEISPYCGWSTTWILNALRDNDLGMLYSFDKINESTKIVPRELKTRWRFMQGDVIKNKETIPGLIPKKIDYLFMDSDHSKEFAKWYIKELFPLVKMGGFICAHDIIKRGLDSKHFKDGEDEILFNFLMTNKIGYFTAATNIPPDWASMNEAITLLRKELGIEDIQKSNSNSMIFFVKEKDELVVNSPEYWDKVYEFEVSKKIDQRSDPIAYEMMMLNIKEWDKVMDFGMGRGDFLAYLLERRKVDAYGVDHSQIALDDAMKKNDSIHTALNLKDFEKEKGTFDVVVSAHTLEHFEDPADKIKELMTYLKPNGYMMIMLPIDDKPWAEHHRIWQVEDVVKLLESFPGMYKMFFRDKIIVPKGYRGHEHNSIHLHKDGANKKDILVIMRFDL